MIYTCLLLFYVGPPPDEGEDGNGPRDSDEESNAAKRELSPKECTKGNSFPHYLG